MRDGSGRRGGPRLLKMTYKEGECLLEFGDLFLGQRVGLL